MRVIATTAGQVLVLLAIASAAALAANAQRGKNSIDLGRRYFGAKPAAAPVAEPGPPPAATGGETGAVAQAASGELPFTVIDLEGVRHAVADTRLLTGEIVIVDARSDQPFQEGRIPGALQFDYYRAEYYADVVPRAMAAQQVIVYCNGGSCEDSVLVCQHFVSLGIPQNHLCLFKDGWEAWKNASLPIETGPGKE